MRTGSPRRLSFATGFCLALGGLAAVSLGGALGAGIARSVAEPTAVASLDLQGLLEQLQESQDREADIRAAVQARADEISALQTAVQGMITELETLPQNSGAERIRLEIEIRAGQQELETRGQLYVQERQLQVTQLLVEMADKAFEAAARVAERDGYDIVIHDNTTALATLPDIDSVLRRLTRTTVYTAESTDITTSVLALMNNEYAAGE
ncbi:MAG: OmpH family outer membrane protein [Planctomycetota bacterium]